MSEAAWRTKREPRNDGIWVLSSLDVAAVDLGRKLCIFEPGAQAQTAEPEGVRRQHAVERRAGAGMGAAGDHSELENHISNKPLHAPRARWMSCADGGVEWS